MMPISEHDQRQLDRMILVLDAFLLNDVGVSGLVSTLSFLLANLDGVSDEWKAAFEDKWLNLEMINAELHEEQRKITPDEANSRA